MNQKRIYGKVMQEVLYNQEISWKGKLVYSALTTYMNGEGICYPSQEILADGLKMSKRSVVYGIDELVKVGILEKKREHRNKNNIYEFRDAGDALQECPEVQEVHPGSAGDAPHINTITIPSKSNTDDFNHFWEEYHNITCLPKTDKKPAEKHWNRLNPDERLTAIANIKPYADAVAPYVKKARTYLADESFNDEFNSTAEFSPMETRDQTMPVV